MKQRILHPNTAKRVLGKMELSEFPNYKEMIQRDFYTFDNRFPHQQKIGTRKYNRMRAKLIRTEQRINRDRPKSEKIRLYCSRQMRIEAKWFLNLTADFKGLINELNKLNKSLKNLDQPQNITWQSPKNGAFGCGYDLFHLQCDAMIDAIGELYNDGNSIAPDRPFDFIEPISTPEKLVEYLTPLRTSNIAKTGINHRDQIGGITGALLQLVYKSYLRDYVNEYVEGFEITDEYKKACTQFLDDWQDPATGFWGQWFESGGKLYKSPDLSITYHTVKYRKGKINYWPELIDTLLAIKDQPYPFGWSVKGHMNNHNSMDVVRLMKLGWDYMSEDQRDRSIADIEEMLDWCLKDSLEPDGTFKFFPFYNSWGDAFYYGSAFLDSVGYINSDNLFWTDKTFPEGKDLCLKIKGRLKELGLDNSGAEGALEILNKDCPCNK